MLLCGPISVQFCITNSNFTVLRWANTLHFCCECWGVSFTRTLPSGRLHSESQWVDVDVCLCDSQGAGTAEEELRHRHCQEEAGGRVCCEYLHTKMLLFIVWGALEIILYKFISPYYELMTESHPSYNVFLSSPPLPSSSSSSSSLPWLLHRFCWCRSLWEES